MLSTDIQKLEKEFPDYIEKARKNYWWNFVVIILDSAFFSFSVTMLSQDTILPYFVSHLTDHKIFIGLVPALFYLGYFFPQLIGAYAVTGKPKRKMYIFWIAVAERAGILAIALIAQFLNLLSDQVTLILLLLSFTVYSFTFGLIIPAYSDLISKNIIRSRGMFFGVMNGVGGLIGFGASLAAAYLLNHFSFPKDLQMLFWLGFATSFISPIFILMFREVPFPFRNHVQPLMHFLRSIPELVKKTPGFTRFMYVRALLNLGLLANAFYALYAMDRFNLPVGALGIFTMVIILSQSVVGFIWGWLGDRFGFRIIYIIASGLLIGMGVLSLTAFADWAFYLIAFCIGGIYAVSRTADSNMVFEIAPPSETSRFIGISNTFVAPVMIFSPLVGGVIVSAFSHQALFFIVLLIGIASAIMTFGFMPDPRKGL